MSASGKAAGKSVGWDKLIIPALITTAGVVAGYYFAAWTIIWAIWLGLFLPSLIPGFRAWGIIASYQIGLPLLAAVLALLIYDVIHDYPVIAHYARLLHDDWVQIVAYFQIVSTLYAVCMAFTLWKAMTDYDSLKNTMRDEANEIKAILAFLKYFENVPDPETGQVPDLPTENATRVIQETLRKYVEQVTGASTSSVEDNDQRLQFCISAVEDLKTPEENDKIALESLINALGELVMIRSRRISLTENRTSPYLVSILGLMSLGILVFFFVFDSKEINAAHIVIPSLSFLYTYLVVMLIDLDRPFAGYWHIRIKAFDDVLAMVKPEAHESTSSASIVDHDGEVQPRKLVG